MNAIATSLTLLLALSASTAFAAKAPCDSELRSAPALTLRQLKERSAERTRELEKITPKPGFENLEVEARTEQVGEQGPQAFQELLPYGVSFVNTPAPKSQDPMAVDLLEEGRSVAVHVDVPWDGRRTSTAAYISLPRPKVNSPSKFMVGSEYPAVIVHLHGGGTPTATGSNGMSIAKEVGKRGIPVIGIDLPGHGRATRNPEGLETFKKQADWLMKVVKQLVDPSVKIVLSGHSWGGSFALFMNRLSQDPNYSRITQYISMAPPLDVTHGGNLKDKLEFEQNYQRNFAELKERIAPSDFDFLNNLLNNGKDSDVSTYFTNITDLDYSLPLLSAEDRAKLKKLTVIVGSADGLVYVGKEEAFAKEFASLPSPSEFILLGPGRSWKSPENPLPTGHNNFDRYMDGTEKTLQSYQIIGDKVVEEVGEFNTSETTGQANLDLIDRAFRHYANFFGFREMLKGRVEYVTAETEHRQPIAKRKGQLEEYIRRVSNAEEEVRRMVDGIVQIPDVQKAIDALRARLGITDSINLRRAEEELATPALTPERRTVLEAYIAEMQTTEEEFRKSFVDAEFIEDMAQLERQYKDIIVELGLTSVNDYKPKYDEYQANKRDNSPGVARMRAALGRLHQDFTNIGKKKLSRYGVARDAKMASIRTPPGVRDLRGAIREISSDQSPERRKKLENYIAEYPRVEAEAKQKAIDEARAKVLAQPRPTGVSGPDDARAQRDLQDSYLNFTYVPPGQPEIALLAREIAELNKELSLLEEGDEGSLSLEKLEASTKATRKRRAALLKDWDGLWKTGKMTSPLVSKLDRSVQGTLTSYKELYFAYEEKKSDFLLQLHQAGRLTAANILALTPEIKSLRRKVQHAKQIYFESRNDLEVTRWVEAIAGHLEGPPDLVAKAAMIGVDVWGTEFARTRRPGANSLTQNLKVEEEYLANRQTQVAEVSLDLNSLRAQYAQRMTAAGQRLPFIITRVEIGRLFDQRLSAVIAELNNRPATAVALSQMLAKWESFLGRLRMDSQSKDVTLN